MPIVLTPTTPIVVTKDEVRLFIQDFPDKNILLDDVEFTQRQLDQAICMVVSKYNTVTPQTGFTVETFPDSLKYLMVLGCASYLLKSCAILQLRNQATLQDGDIAPIGIDDKAPMYLQMAELYGREWDALVKKLKIQQNMECGYGQVSSGYVNIYRYNRV